MLTKTHLPPLAQMSDDIKAWFASDLGVQFVAAERRALNTIMPTVFGYHLLQIGIDPELTFFESSATGHNFVMLPRVELGMPRCGLAGSAEELPFASECIDAVVLHHVLDFSVSPHQVLREAARVLRPGGKLVIVGFNPASLWGVCRRFRRSRAEVPWSGHFVSYRRLQDWLAFLELRELSAVSGFYRPPMVSERWMRRWAFLEGLGERYHANNGGFLVVVACKETLAMTPLQKRWKRKRLLGIPVGEPVRPKCRRQASQEKRR